MTRVELPASEASPPPESALAPPPVKKRRWLRWLLAVGLIAVGVWHLPGFVASTPLRKEILSLAKKDLPAGVEIGRVSLDWMKPVELEDVRIPGPTGAPLVEVESIRSEKTLWELAIEPLKRGRFHLRGVTLTIIARAGGPHLAPTLRGLLTARPKSGKSYHVSLTESRIQFVDAQWQPLTEISGITADLDIGGRTDGGGSIRAAGRVTWPHDQGQITVDGAWGRDMSTGRVEIAATDLPLDALQPGLAPYLDGRTLHGDATTTISTDWTRSPTEGLRASLAVELPKLDVQLAAAQPDQTPVEWTDEDGAGHLEIQMSPDADDIEVTNLAVRAAGIDLTAAGRVAEVRERGLVDLRGRVIYDLDPLFDRMGPSTRAHVRVTGLEARSIDVHGPLFNPKHLTVALSDPAEAESVALDRALEFRANLGWDSAVAYGISSNEGRMAATWHAGELSFEPQEVAVSGGWLRSGPTLRLHERPLTARLPAGPLLENVQFSPEMCRTWLKYLSPVLADATSIDGRFSLSFEEGAIPLAKISDGQFRGELAMHTADVGPGPLAQSVAGLVAQLQTIVTQRRPQWLDERNARWLRIEEQQVPVALEGGRVHHGRMEMHVGEAVLVSHGSVGIDDDSLDLTLELAIPDRWSGSSPALASLKGEVIVFRMGGTLNDPRIDTRPLAEFARRMAVKAPVNLLFDFLKRK